MRWVDREMLFESNVYFEKLILADSMNPKSFKWLLYKLLWSTLAESVSVPLPFVISVKF